MCYHLRFIASLTSTSIGPRVLLKRKLQPDRFRLSGAQIILSLCRSALPFPPIKPGRFSMQSYRLPRLLRGAKGHRTRQDGRIGAYRACPRPAVGVFVSPPNLDAVALLPGEDAVMLDLVQSVGRATSTGSRGRMKRGGAPSPVGPSGALARPGAGAFHD